MKQLAEYGLDDQIGLDYAKKYFQLKAENIDINADRYGRDIANKIDEAKCGYMYIRKISDIEVFEQGWCGVFGVGLSCVLNIGSAWYHTSLVKDIDWDKKIFHTQNSTYSFRLEEYDAQEILNYINNKNKNMLKVKVINTSNNPLPKYATAQSAGLDLRANIEEPVTLFPRERKLIPTGLHISLPEGYEAQIRPRSGLALKYGISLVNTPGTIDSDYTGDIGVIVINHGDQSFTINPGDRICQMVINKYEQIEWEETDSLKTTERGDGGFGHTGKI